MLNSWISTAINVRAKSRSRRQRRLPKPRRRTMLFERLDDRAMLSAVPGTATPHEQVQSGFTADQLAASLVGPGVSISNAKFTGGASAAGSFTFTDSTVIG